MCEKKSIQEAWQNALEVIKLENTLAHHRKTAMLTLQGFLFAAFSFAFKTLMEKPTMEGFNFYIFGFLLLLALIGSITVWSFYETMRSAYKHVESTRCWFYYYWRRKNEGLQEEDCPPFPCLTGGGEFDRDYNWYYDDRHVNYSEKNHRKFVLEEVFKPYNQKHSFFTLSNINGSLGVTKILCFAWMLIFLGLIVLYLKTFHSC